MRMPFDPNKPHNELPPLPPRAELETKAILKACIAAHKAIANLEIAAAELPNPDILISTLSLLEAKASSEIENIVTTDDELFRQAALDDDNAPPEVKETLRYRTAMFDGYTSLRERPLSTRTAVEICRTIKGRDIDIRRVPGTTLRNQATGEVIYTPPVGEEVLRGMLANWEKFLHAATDLDPLVRMAVQHYQFEAIHPFSDGNGRTGRILAVLHLIEQKVLRRPILYLSRPVLEHKDGYYLLLDGVTRYGRWEQWIEFMLKAVTIAARHGTIKAMGVRILMTHTDTFIKSHAASIHSRELVALLFQQPYCRIADFDAAGIAKRQTASQYLQALVRLGILDEARIGRSKLFLHRKFAELLMTDGSEITEYIPNAARRGKLLFAKSIDGTAT